MAIQAYHLVVGTVRSTLGAATRFILAPYEEGRRQRQFALYQESTYSERAIDSSFVERTLYFARDLFQLFSDILFQKSIASEGAIAPTLVGRITHLMIGMLLLFPGSNIVLCVALRHFECDSGRQFCQAIEEGDLKRLDFFLKIGWNPNQQFRQKPLIFIAYDKGQKEVLKRLLEEPGCDSNVFHKGKTLLHVAAEKKDTQGATLLLDNKASAKLKRAEDKCTAAGVAYKKGETQLAIMIANRGRGINDIVDQRNKTLFDQAWESKDFEEVTSLIQKGAKPSQSKRSFHFDVLAYFYRDAGNKNLIITSMYQAGWDLNACDDEGNSLFSLAVESRDWAFARRLVEYGVHIDTMKPKAARMRLKDITAVSGIPRDQKHLLTFSQYQDDLNFYTLFLEDAALFPSGVQKCRPRNWLRSETYLKWAIPSLIARCRENGNNPLEKVFFMGSEVAMQHLARHLTFAEFNHHLMALRIKYGKRIQTGSILNALYAVSARHFREFEEMTIESESVEKPKSTVFVKVIPESFSRLQNLSDEDLTFEGKKCSQEELLASLNHLLKTVVFRREIAGLPEDKQEREKLFDKLDNLLRQTAYYLYQPDVSDEVKKKALLDLAYAGNCSRGWDVTFYQVYCSLADRNYQVLTFADRVMIELGQYRLKLLFKMYEKDRAGFKFALSKICDSRRIPKQPPNEESITDQGRSQLKEELIFDSFYTPDTMVKAVLGKRSEDQSFADYMFDYFKETISNQWIEAPFPKMKKEAARIKNPENLTPDEVQAFFAKRSIDVPKKLGDRSITLESTLDYVRYMSCYSAVESEKHPEETLPLGVAKMLESMGHLKLRDPYLFCKSFNRSLYDRWIRDFID